MRFSPTSCLPASFVATLLCTASAFPVTIYVDIANQGDSQQDGDVAHPFATIQQGLDAARVGDEVVILSGIYAGQGNRDLDPRGKNLTIRSSDPRNPAVVESTVIDCQAAGRGFSFHSGEGPACTILGLTITNGRAANGGAIYCANSSPTIMNCAIIGNAATRSGGAIHCLYASPIIAHCVLRANHAATQGGAIDCFFQSHPQIIDCMIGENTAGGAGAGIYCCSGHPVIINCTIAANQAGGDGGGIHCYYNSNPSVANCCLIANTAVGHGGGVSGKSSSPVLISCTLAGNRADGTGGGLTIAGGSVSLANLIAWDNHAPSGAQISLRRDPTAAQATVTHCDIQGGRPDILVEPDCTMSWGAGNIDADPLFADPDGPDDSADTWIDNDYRPHGVSPCVDAGDNTTVPPDVPDLDGDGDTTEPLPLDVQGRARFLDETCAADTGRGTPPIVDIGAHEYQPADTDTDGIGDACDRCPGFDDRADEDGDGVADGCDDCRKSVPGSTVDEHGCPALIMGDFDRDGDVDEVDLAAFHQCASAPLLRPRPGCEYGDLDRDDDIDQSDFGLLQGCLSGRNSPAHPDCAARPPVVRGLVSLSILGPDHVPLGSATQFAAIARYDDGVSEEVTTSTRTTWSVTAGPGSIQDGLYTAPADLQAKACATIAAVLLGDGIDKQDSKQISIVLGRPTAGPQPRVNTTGDAPIDILLIGAAPDAQAELAFVIVSLPGHGTLHDPQMPGASIAPGYVLGNHGRSVTYTPQAGWSGTTAFEFKVNYGAQDSDIAVCAITVHLPAIIPEDTAWATITLVPTQPNQTPGDPLTFIIVTLPAHGLLMDPNDPFGGDGNLQDYNDFLDFNELPHPLTFGGNQVLYQPDPDYYGTDAFDYESVAD